jgi:lipid II:glycine glycyltransferase (peptidoglycan interpeptide bridge formation enzyme)
LKVYPEWTTPQDRAVLLSTGGRLSRHPIQHQATLVLDISGGDEAQVRLTKSARYYIRYGERKGITVEASDAPSALDAFYELLEETAARHRFVIRPRSYYLDLLRAFRERKQIAVYLARHAGRPVAGAVMLLYGTKLIYLFGATSVRGRELNSSYVLQWRAIQDAQQRGCTRYDMWGIPLDPTPPHPGYGYYFFKSRFNGELVRYIGLYDLPVRQVLALGLRFVERIGRPGRSEFV